MANLRRHFHFGLNKTPSLGSHLHGQTVAIDSNADQGKVHFNRSAFMNDIYNCLDHCSAYIQALNSLCGAGTLLAQSFIHVFCNVPLYHEAAAQFLNAWEDVSKATAGASAAIKTETLMTLQEVVNKLEADSCHLGSDTGVLTESIQAAGSCLFSYVELQAQFSLVAWQSLNKLSKHLGCTVAVDRKLPMSAEVDDMGKSPDLTATIKKHFAHLLQKFGAAKLPNPPEQPALSRFYVNMDDDGPSSPSPPSGLCHLSDAVVGSPPGMWSLSNAYPSTRHGQSSGMLPQHSIQVAPSQKIENLKKGVLDTPCELEEVINLLSCKPGGQTSGDKLHHGRLSPEDSFGMTGSPSWNGAKESVSDGHAQDPVTSASQLFPTASPLALYDGKQTWPRVGSSALGFGFDSWIWGSTQLEPPYTSSTEGHHSALLQGHHLESCNASSQESSHNESGSNLWSDVQRWRGTGGENCSSSDDASSNNGHDSSDVFLGLDLVGRDLMASVRQRRHSSSDGLPDLTYTESSAPKLTETAWEIRANKTSTWPLKQTSPRISDTHLVGSGTGVGLASTDTLGIWSDRSASDATARKTPDLSEKKYMLFGQPL